MKLHARSIVALLACAGTLNLLGGCEDSAAQQRDEVQVQLRQASMKLNKAMVGGTADESSAQALGGIVSELGRIEGGEPGQQAAKSLLAATALHEMANVDFNKAEQIELTHSMQRSVLHGHIDAVLRLTAMASVLEDANASAERQQLKSNLDAARTEVIALREKVDQLDTPIGEQASMNAASKKEVEALRLKVSQLRRAAQELGYADGLDTYKQAIAVNRQADKIEYDISQREIDLEYSLTPELVRTDTQAQQLDAMIQAIEEAHAQLEAFAKATSEEEAITRKQIADFTALITAAMKEIESRTAEDLNGTYDSASASLEKAATQAQAAVRALTGRSEDAQAARLVAVQVHETNGRVHWVKARRLLEHATLLQRLTAASIGGNYTAELQQATSAYNQAIEQAKTAYSSAHEALTQVQSRTNPERIAAFSTSIGNAVAALGGVAPSTISSDGMEESSSNSIAPPLADPSTMQFNSAEELRTYMATMPKDAQGMRASLAVLHAESPQGQRAVQAQADMVEAMISIDSAMQEKFGQGLFESMGPAMASMTPDLSKATVAEETDDRVVYTISMMGQTQRTVIRNVNGNWKVDMDDLDPQVAAQLPMLEKMTSGMKQAAADIVNRIQSDEFANAQEVMMAFGQAMAGSMGGMN